jgi:hypothetical protein
VQLKFSGGAHEYRHGHSSDFVLNALNRDYIQSVKMAMSGSSTKSGQDFLCSNPDGSLVYEAISAQPLDR